MYGLPVQDGGGEGHVLISFCESTKTATSCWTTIDRGHRKPPKKKKKNALCPKTKKKLQQDGRMGTNTIKSNPIHAKRETHKLKNNNTQEVLQLLWKFWASCQAYQPEDLAKELGICRNLTVKASRIWLQNFHRTRGNRDSTPGGHKQNLAHTKV